MASSFTRFLDHTQLRRTALVRTPLDEWSARRRDLYLTTHNTRNRHPCPGGIRTLNLSRRVAAGLRLKADSHIACRAHAIPPPCRAAKCLECVFPIWFTQCSRVWLTLDMPCPCHALTMPRPWEERIGQSMAWARHGKCESHTAALCKSNGKDTF
jgi:hypothetical protein